MSMNLPISQVNNTHSAFYQSRAPHQLMTPLGDTERS